MKSCYTLYHLWTIFTLTVVTGFMIHWFLINQLNLKTLSNFVFYVTGLLSAIFLLKLASEWPQLVRSAANIERRVAEIHVTKIRVAKFNTIAYVILIMAAIEHSLSMIFKVKNVILCWDEDNFEKNFVEDFFQKAFAFIFQYVPCNVFTITVFIVANIQATFLWNFTDVMTMCFSMYLTSYFRDLNAIINSQTSKKTHSWEKLRYYYSQLVELVQAVDSKMCYLILLSVFTNLFFICLQLYNALNSSYNFKENCILKTLPENMHIDTGINLSYYAYSATFLAIRASIMFALAINVNTVAREPIHVLSCIPSQEYTIHVQRFNRQLRYTTTALSGLFFYVTRGMILKVFATIVTYELVLLQFN